MKAIKIWLCAILFLASSMGLMTAYVNGPLNGDFNKHFMQAARFGIPAELQKHGIEPLYRDSENAGWDGQFYFYMANDLLARNDARQHMDSDAYRYQRIGVPLLAKTVSVLLGQDWVSPGVYYATQFALILLATILAAAFFAEKSLSPFWILPWCLAAGTQITLLNGLPDGSADALLIMALIALHKKRYVLYAVAAALACLAREGYVLLPLMVCAAHLLLLWRRPEVRLRIHQYACLLVPVLLFGAWQVFIRLKFGYAPGTQSGNVLGLPLMSTVQLLAAGLMGHYPNVPMGGKSYLSGAGIALYILVMLAGVWSAARIKASKAFTRNDPLPLALKGFVFVLFVLYACFGDTVMWHFTGYMKAADLLIFVVPFAFALNGEKLRSGLVIALFAVTTLFFGTWVVKMRVLQPPIFYQIDSRCGHLQFEPGGTCKEKFFWRGKELPGVIGRRAGDSREAQPRDHKDFLTFGPYLDLPRGKYHIALSYSGVGETLGYMDVFSILAPPSGKTFQKIELTAKSDGLVELDFDVTEDLIKSVEVRVWHEHGTLTVHSLTIEKL